MGSQSRPSDGTVAAGRPHPGGTGTLDLHRVLVGDVGHPCGNGGCRVDQRNMGAEAVGDLGSKQRVVRAPEHHDIGIGCCDRSEVGIEQVGRIVSRTRSLRPAPDTPAR